MHKTIIGFARDHNFNQGAPYTVKFALLISAIAAAKNDGSEELVVAEPWVLGDTHAELIESLSRLAGTRIGLVILQRRRSAMHIQN